MLDFEWFTWATLRSHGCSKVLNQNWCDLPNKVLTSPGEDHTGDHSPSARTWIERTWFNYSIDAPRGQSTTTRRNLTTEESTTSSENRTRPWFYTSASQCYSCHFRVATLRLHCIGYASRRNQLDRYPDSIRTSVRWSSWNAFSINPMRHAAHAVKIQDRYTSFHDTIDRRRTIPDQHMSVETASLGLNGQKKLSKRKTIYFPITWQAQNQSTHSQWRTQYPPEIHGTTNHYAVRVWISCREHSFEYRRLSVW